MAVLLPEKNSGTEEADVCPLIGSCQTFPASYWARGQSSLLSPMSVWAEYTEDHPPAAALESLIPSVTPWPHHGDVRLPGPGGVVPAGAGLLRLLRGVHHQHDELLEWRQGLLRPHPRLQARPRWLGDCEDQQPRTVSLVIYNTQLMIPRWHRSW